jgi:cyclase
MMRPRVIPTLLLSGFGLVKTRKFADPVYVGDPTNAVRIFNSKEVDELMLLDIDASRSRRGPDFALLEEIAAEAFMPLGYGGGVASVGVMERLFRIGFEKVVINSAIYENPALLREAVACFGSQSVVASVDAKKDFLGRYRVVSRGGTVRQPEDLSVVLQRVQDDGVGELILNSVDKDGMMLGYDIELVSRGADVLRIPLVALGGAGSTDDMKDALKAGASAVAAGSMFVFHGVHRAVLISYLDHDQRDF